MRPYRARCTRRTTHFNPRIPVRNATAAREAEQRLADEFQSTHSCAECDNEVELLKPTVDYFNPRIPVRNATGGMKAGIEGDQFQSTHSCAECDAYSYAANSRAAFISIHAFLCGMRLIRIVWLGALDTISIHAFLCGMRLRKLIDAGYLEHFNPRIPVRNATWAALLGEQIETPFQSTHSCAECDGAKLCTRHRFLHFNPRIPVRNATCGVWKTPV